VDLRDLPAERLRERLRRDGALLEIPTATAA